MINGKYCINTKTKKRYIIPLVKTKNGSIRINKLSVKANNQIEEFLNQSNENYYSYFNFSFEPYEEKVEKLKLK